jgi:hypothetical protein
MKITTCPAIDRETGRLCGAPVRHIPAPGRPPKFCPPHMVRANRQDANRSRTGRRAVAEAKAPPQHRHPVEVRRLTSADRRNLAATAHVHGTANVDDTRPLADEGAWSRIPPHEDDRAPRDPLPGRLAPRRPVEFSAALAGAGMRAGTWQITFATDRTATAARAALRDATHAYLTAQGDDAARDELLHALGYSERRLWRYLSVLAIVRRLFYQDRYLCTVLILSFGLFGHEPMTAAKIGRRYGRTPAEVYQARNDAVARVVDALNNS